MRNRVKVELNGTSIFTTTIPLLVGHMNYGNHMGNDSVLGLAHEARIRWLESLAASELDCMGASLIMNDAMIEYRGEGFRGEEVVIDIYPGELHRYGFDLFYDMNVAEKSLARVKSGLMFFDYQTRKVTNAPEKWKEFYAELV